MRRVKRGTIKDNERERERGMRDKLPEIENLMNKARGSQGRARGVCKEVILLFFRVSLSGPYGVP